MNAVSPNRRPLYVAVILSFLTFCAFAWIRGGVAATPYTATDSQGRTMGFNDVFSAEHYGIILRNADLRHALQVLTEDDLWLQHWALLAAHLAMLVLLAKAGARTIRWFLVAQPVLFFWGWFGFWLLPVSICDLVWGHTGDRESFVDIPYVAIMSQGAWFLACGFIFWKLQVSLETARQGGFRTRLLMISGKFPRMTAAEKKRADRRSQWKLEVVSDFAEAEASLRRRWHAATSAERSRLRPESVISFMAKPQLPPDFKEFLKLCLKHEVRFMMIGGLAVIPHGHPK